jgi:hypothetical protein
MRWIGLAVVLTLLTGCQVTDIRAQSILMSPAGDRPRQFIPLGAEQYQGELTFALVEEGFTVKPLAITQGVAEFETPSRLVSYREAGFGYALKIALTHDHSVRCVFSGSHRVSATMLVIDIGTNETLAAIKQVGPDGSCPPLTPIWTLLARELSRVWK